jgi:acetylornithine deacetylase
MQQPASESPAEVLAALIRIDSQNPALAPGAPGEYDLAAFCVEWLTRHGVDAWTEEAAPGRPNVVARAGSGAGPVLVLCAHLDTVAAADMQIPPFEPRVEQRRMYGRGAYDMKGGVAAILCALAALAQRPLRGTVMAALVVDEEYESLGAADFVRRHSADACILTEPSDGRLIVAHKGFVWLEVTTRGVAAHGSRWEDGASAIGRMAQVVSALDALDRDVLRTRTHPLVGPASLHCATISGGEGWSTYAAACTLRVERRTIPGEDVDAAVQEIRDCIAATGIEAGVAVRLVRSPLECPADSPVAAAVRAAVTEATGAEPVDGGVAYWMDAAIFADAGMATVNYGPSGGGAHAAVEWVDLDSVEQCARVVEAAAARFCG